MKILAFDGGGGCIPPSKFQFGVFRGPDPRVAILVSMGVGARSPSRGIAHSAFHPIEIPRIKAKVEIFLQVFYCILYKYLNEKAMVEVLFVHLG